MIPSLSIAVTGTINPHRSVRPDGTGGIFCCFFHKKSKCVIRGIIAENDLIWFPALPEKTFQLPEDIFFPAICGNDNTYFCHTYPFFRHFPPAGGLSPWDNCPIQQDPVLFPANGQGVSLLSPPGYVPADPQGKGICVPLFPLFPLRGDFRQYAGK